VRATMAQVAVITCGPITQVRASGT